jgi:MraZ protein
VAPRFFGRYEHSLDAKGRIILPARFRNQLGTQAFVSQYQDRCLALWTAEEFERQMDEQEEKQVLGRRERNVARILASGSSEVEVDRQGRVALPAFLRNFAGLQTESSILVIGAINRVELWNPAEWDLRVLPDEAHLVDDPPQRPEQPTPAAAASAEAP